MWNIEETAAYITDKKHKASKKQNTSSLLITDLARTLLGNSDGVSRGNHMTTLPQYMSLGKPPLKET
jgi:hypothetical protein